MIKTLDGSGNTRRPMPSVEDCQASRLESDTHRANGRLQATNLVRKSLIRLHRA